MSRNKINRTGRARSHRLRDRPRREGPPQTPILQTLAWFDPRQFGWMSYLLVAIPIAGAASLLHWSPVVRFLAAGIAIIPLAGVMGRATEQLAHRLGPGIGGLLNATFGNAAELILALFALREGLDSVVKASLTGSIIGNLLLVLGASLFAGGLKYPIQRFNRTAAGAGSTLMVLATVGLIVPALFHNMVPNAPGIEHRVSVAVGILLVFTYILSLVFSLGTHRELLTGLKEEEAAAIAEETWGLRHASTILLVATIFVAWMSEILVGAVEPAGEALGLNAVFMGVFVVAIVGNAAEHSTALIMALKNQTDLAVGIALGSALQVGAIRGAGAGLRQLPPRDADGPTLLHPGSSSRDPRRAGSQDGRRGRRVKLARRGHATHGLRHPRSSLLLPTNNAKTSKGPKDRRSRRGPCPGVRW